MIAGWLSSRRVLEVPCSLDLEESFESLHAYVELEGVEIEPGDEVIVHDPPTTVPAYGERLVWRGRATVIKASPLERWWIRLKSRLELTELYEVGFQTWRTP